MVVVDFGPGVEDGVVVVGGGLEMGVDGGAVWMLLGDGCEEGGGFH